MQETLRVKREMLGDRHASVQHVLPRAPAASAGKT